MAKLTKAQREWALDSAARSYCHDFPLTARSIARGDVLHQPGIVREGFMESFRAAALFAPALSSQGDAK